MPGGGGGAGKTLTLSPGPRRTPVAPGAVPALQVPAYADTLSHGSDVFDLGAALLHSGDQQGFQLVPHADAAWSGALFVALHAGNRGAFTTAVPSAPVSEVTRECTSQQPTLRPGYCTSRNPSTAALPGSCSI